jgi:glycosyltransferase involved in cell wall biosynthesis
VFAMKQPRVSVIIPNYNYAHYLPQTLESVLAQSYPDVEIIVVDDGSSDDSRKVLEQFEGRVRLIEQQNRGVAAARNNGARQSSGQLIAFLDADDIWLPLKLERQVELFLSQPELGLVHCGVEEIDAEGNHLSFRSDGLEGWVAKELLLLERAVILGGGSGLVVPRATFDALGGFNERLSTSADWDFFYRIAARQRVGFVPEPLLQYRIHGTNMHANIGLMERDMLHAYSEAFSHPDPEIGGLRRRCYGNLHMTLAGSFFRQKKYYDFARHMMKSLWLTPRNSKRVLEFPLRLWRRARA